MRFYQGRKNVFLNSCQKVNFLTGKGIFLVSSKFPPLKKTSLHSWKYSSSISFDLASIDIIIYAINIAKTNKVIVTFQKCIANTRIVSQSIFWLIVLKFMIISFVLVFVEYIIKFFLQKSNFLFYIVLNSKIQILFCLKIFWYKNLEKLIIKIKIQNFFHKFSLKNIF